MKRHFTSLLVGLAIGICPVIVNAQVSISGGINVNLPGAQINSPADFYQPLSSYGNWVEVPQYGRCWRPRDVSSDWQPYVYGQWVWTDAGWFWQSAEPWGWATCHYGSWVNDPNYSWCWIPGTEWAPAWVTWRQSDDYIGWAPCGPNLSVLAPSFFVFTGVHDFGREFHGRRDFVENNPTIINRTRVINDFSSRNVNVDGREKRIRYNKGPAVEPIQRATGRTFQARPVQDVIRERQPANLHENRPQQSQEERNRLEQEQRQNRNEQQPQEQRPQEQRNRNEQPGLPPKSSHQPPQQPGRVQPETPQQQRPISPTGQEHGISTPPQQREVPQPTPPNRNEQPVQRPATPQERPVPPTGQEHGISTPPQQREVPQPVQRPATPQERPVPPTGQEHGVSTPPQQREVPHPAQPAQPNRPMPQPLPPQQRQVPPTGQEHGISQPPQQRQTARPQSNPKAEQPAPPQEKAPKPEQQGGKEQRNP